MPQIEIRPSLLEIKTENLGQSLHEVAPLVKTLHLDIGDGHFIARKTILGADFVKKIKAQFPFEFEVHLMVDEPVAYIPAFITAGAKKITFHIESSKNPREVIDFILKGGALAGLALKIETAVEFSKTYWPQLDEILLMSVHPGFGGQTFLPSVLGKIKRIRELGWDKGLIVDGGIKEGVARQAVENGADILVCGTYLFDHGIIEDNYKKLLKDIAEVK